MITSTSDGMWRIEESVLNDSTGTVIRELEGHSEPISYADISSDGKLYLTATCPKVGIPETKLWDKDGNALLTIPRFGGKVGFMPGDRAFYTYTFSCCAECDADPSVIIWPIDANGLIVWVNTNKIHQLNGEEMSRYNIDLSLLPSDTSGVALTGD